MLSAAQVTRGNQVRPLDGAFLPDGHMAKITSGHTPTVILPDGSVPVVDLPASHPAAVCLLDRGVDLHDLDANWGIDFCTNSLYTQPNPGGRLLIPIFYPDHPFAVNGPEPRELVVTGWMARAIPGVRPMAAPDVKYLLSAGLEPSTLLYGLPQAQSVPGPVVLLEEPSDVWLFGPGALSLQGEVLSDAQRTLLQLHFPGRPIVIMLRPGSLHAAQQIQRQLQLVRTGSLGDSRVMLADFPPSCLDPGQYAPVEMTEIVTMTLAKTG